jgi:hypothetical protein
MNGERDPQNPVPEPEPEPVAEHAREAEPEAPEADAEDGAAGDRDVSDEELDSVSGGMF